jgi:hypothetical protein
MELLCCHELLSYVNKPQTVSVFFSLVPAANTDVVMVSLNQNFES